MSKKWFDEQKIVLRRHFTLPDQRVLAPMIKYTERLMERLKRVESELYQLRNTHLIKQTELEQDAQFKSKQEREREKHIAIVRAMKAQLKSGQLNEEHYKLCLKSMGFSEMEADSL